MKISLKKLIYSFIAICIYLGTVFNIREEFFPLYKSMQYFVIVIVGFYLLPKFSVILKKQHRKLNILLLLFVLVTLSVSYINRDSLSLRDPFLAAIVFCALQVEMFWFIEYSLEKGWLKDFVSIGYRVALILVLINDLLILFKIGAYAGTATYMLGTKFEVSYAHIVLMVLFWGKNEPNGKRKLINKLCFAAYSILAFCMVIMIDCNTGMIGIAITVFIYFFPKRIYFYLKKQTVFLIIMLSSVAFVAFHEFVLSITWIQKIVTEVLDRTLTLTGRIDIFNAVFDVLEGHYLIGYGYGSGYEICMKYMGYADVQNGLFEWILSIGIPGTLILVLICCISFRAANRTNGYNRTLMAVITFIYVMIVLGFVEITLREQFLFFVALLYGFAIEQKS